MDKNKEFNQLLRVIGKITCLMGIVVLLSRSFLDIIYFIILLFTLSSLFYLKRYN